MSYSNLPVPGPEAGLSRYMQEIRKFPMLEKDQEYMLAKAWVDHGDTDSAHQLVTSHLRLAAKIAMGYRGYGLPTAEVVSEANVGLMQAVKRFDPEKGFRLATYAMWWIRASIQEYILRSWSLVKMGTTSAQNGDASLNATVSNDGEGAAQWQDWLEDETADQAGDYAEADELQTRRDMMMSAMEVLNEREREILTERRLQDEPKTLEQLSEVYSVSRERIRQIEVRAFEKLQKKMRELAADQGLLKAVN